MKKTGLLFLFCLLTTTAFSQVNFSLRLSPALTVNRFTDKDGDDLISPSSNGGGVSFVGGMAVDFSFTDNLALSLGLNYVATQLNGKYSTPFGSYDFKRNVQYVQTPVTLKAFTNEIATDMKLYFQLGPTFSVKIAEKLKSSNSTGPDADKDNQIVSPVDAGLYLGAGVLYGLGETTSVFAGLYYNRGLTNVTLTNTTARDYNKYAAAHIDLIGLEAGIRF